MSASTEEKLDAAMKAVRHILRRINEDAKTAYLMGHCTESYDLLCTAVATHDGRTKESIEDDFPPCPPESAELQREAGTGRPLGTHCRSLPLAIVHACKELGVAPFLAREVLRLGSPRGEALAVPRIDPEDGRPMDHFYTKLERGWMAWTDRRARKPQAH